MSGNDSVMVVTFWGHADLFSSAFPTFSSCATHPPVHPSQHPPFYYDEAPHEKHVLQHFQQPENPCIVYSSWAARAVSCLHRRLDHLWIAWSWTSWWVRVENVQDAAEMPYPEGWCEHSVSIKSRTHLCIYMLRHVTLLLPLTSGVPPLWSSTPRQGPPVPHMLGVPKACLLV